MQHKQLQFGHGFRVVLGDKHSQAAQMMLNPGEAEGGPDNCHKAADQWLYVESGSGLALVNGHRIDLRKNTLLLIHRGEMHEIRNSGMEPLRTFSIYVPPAYTSDGDELPRGECD